MPLDKSISRIVSLVKIWTGRLAFVFASKKKRRQKLRQRPFPEAWIEIIERLVPFYQVLPASDQQELLGHIQIFINEKQFVGCGGLAISDAMRVAIAAQACILLLHRSTDYFPHLTSVFVYPHPFVSLVKQHLPGGVVSEGMQARVGESWGYGTVILAWDTVLEGARDIYDGHNVVLHEFAHQLDEESGDANGMPILPMRSQYTTWARVLSAEFLELNQDTEHRRKTIMDKYGATNPAEFFAVATETFFEKGLQLRRKHPELYEELKVYYQQDPAFFHQT